MRKSALLWLFMAVLAGGVLFHTSQRVNDGRTELDKISQSLRKEDENLRVLQAEWSYLNQPDRLEKLSKKYLHLEPLKGSQFTKTEDLGEKPPPAETAAAPVEAEKKEPPPVKAVKIVPPAQRASPVLAPAAKPPREEGPATATAPASRNFGDVINSLGVR